MPIFIRHSPFKSSPPLQRVHEHLCICDFKDEPEGKPRAKRVTLTPVPASRFAAITPSHRLPSSDSLPGLPLSPPPALTRLSNASKVADPAPMLSERANRPPSMIAPRESFRPARRCSNCVASRPRRLSTGRRDQRCTRYRGPRPSGCNIRGTAARSRQSLAGHRPGASVSPVAGQ